MSYDMIDARFYRNRRGSWDVCLEWVAGDRVEIKLDADTFDHAITKLAVIIRDLRHAGKGLEELKGSEG